MSFGVKLKTTTSKVIANARIGLIKWTGTADAPTKEIVGTWASDGTNPTLATSLSYENTPANIGLTTSWARHTVEDITVDSDTTNIVIFIWSDDGTIAANDEMSISEWQLNPGSTVNAFATPTIEVAQASVDRYLCVQKYDLGDSHPFAVGDTVSTTSAMFYPHWRTVLHKNPTVTLVAAGIFQYVTEGAAKTVSAVAASYPCKVSCRITLTIASSTRGATGYVRGTTSNVPIITANARIGA
jgi:hypothetical protein